MRRLSDRQLAHRESHASDVRAFVGYNFQFGVPFNQALGELRRTAKPSHVEIRFLTAAPRTEGVFPSVMDRLIWDTLIHPVHMALSILGQPKEIFVSAQYLDAPLVGVHIHILHEEGGQTTIATGNYAHRFDMFVRVTGRSGVAFELDELTRIRMYGLPGYTFASKEVVELGWPIRRSNGPCTGYLPALEAFFEVIRRGIPSPSSLAGSIATIATLQEIAERLAVNDSCRNKVSA